jgi:phosphoribosylformimino-5-aminoimidazole carboxamide ribotide isomerase
MLVLPAIDVRGGKCVRLLRGDYARETVFSDDPAAMARRWLEGGASALHVVDLDGAREGRSVNAASVRAIVAAAAAVKGRHVVTQLGGGIRDMDAVDHWLGLGVERVILGTVAVTNPALVTEAAARYPGRVWVGIDARAGKVAVSGWTEATALDAHELALRVKDEAAAGIVFTNIDRDGTGAGVDVEATAALARRIEIPVIASGGVRSRDDLRRLCAAGADGIVGVIVGRALYEGTVSLRALLEEAGAA